MTNKRAKELRLAVRKQVTEAIRADLAGGESLMKEVFEMCQGDLEYKTVDDEMRALIALIGEQT